MNVSPVDPAGFSLEFMPLEVGPHQLGIVYGGHCPVMEPLTIMAYDSSCIRVMGVKDGLVGCQPSKFIGTFFSNLLLLHCMLSLAVQCIVISPVCNGRTGWRAGGVQTLLQPSRAQCLRLSEHFFISLLFTPSVFCTYGHIIFTLLNRQ